MNEGKFTDNDALDIASRIIGKTNTISEDVTKAFSKVYTK